MRKEKPKMRYQKTGVDVAMHCSTLNLTLVITTPPYIVVSGQGDGSILDGGSGRINGNLKFRLNDVDAGETGGVGAAIGGAKCELERERGYEAKEWIVGYTRGVELKITDEYGLDKYDRLVVDLSANGRDVGRAGMDLKHLKSWPHKGRRALARKPDWCER